MARLGEGPESSTWKKTKTCRISSKLGSFFFQTKRLFLSKKKNDPPKKNYSSAQDTGQWLKGHHETTSAFESQKQKGLKLLCKCAKILAVLFLPILTIYCNCSILFINLVIIENWSDVFDTCFFWSRKYFLLGSGQRAGYDELHRVRSWKLQMYSEKILQRYFFHNVWTYFWSWWYFIMLH